MVALYADDRQLKRPYDVEWTHGTRQCTGLVAHTPDAGLEHVSKLTTLEVLSLTHVRVTDAGLKDLRGLSRLKKLSLDGTSISDAGLAHLKGLKNLRVLCLRNTEVTAAGVAGLKGALPGLTIED